MTKLSDSGILINSALSKLSGDNRLSANVLRDMPSGGGALPGIYAVDDYGAVGDCPRTGSTSGATDDSDAIEAAFTAVTDGGSVYFTPGKVYMVTREIEVKGKSFNVEATGATIRCGDDTVWHVFDFGGTSVSDTEYWYRWRGGIIDGNLANQRYYPNTDGTTIYTDEGTELIGSYTGTPFYENSSVNGTTWDNDWIDGNAGDGVNVNGGGNIGLIRFIDAQLAIFEDIECRSFVRNGLVTYRVREVHANRIRGIDQLYTSYQELVSLFGLGHECAVMKFSGDNLTNEIIGVNYPERVFVSNCYAERCVMPLFVRSQPPKAPVLGIECKVTNCTFTGVSRELWFEVAQDLVVTGTTITCADFRDSTFRNNDAVFMGNGTENYTFTDCHIYGRVNTEEAQGRVRGVYNNCLIRDFSASDQRTLQCGTLNNCIVETRASGLIADYVRGSQLYLENVAGSDPVVINRAMTDTVYGRERYTGTRERIIMPAAAVSATLSGTPSEIQRIYARSRAFQGGRWFELAEQDYDLSGAVITLTKSGQDFSSDGSIEIEVDWYSNTTDTLTTTAGLETTYTLSQAGGTRKQDITSITYNGVAIGHKFDDTSNPDVNPHWTAAMNAAGLMVITLTNVTVVDGQDLVVTYRPPLEPYRYIRTGVKGDTLIDITGTNFNGIYAYGGTNRIKGIYSDIQAPVFVEYRDGVESVEIDGATVDRMSGGLVCGENTTAQVNCLRIKRSHIIDWMMEFERLDAAGDVAEDRAVGCVVTQGAKVLRRMEFSGNVMEFSGREAGASTDTGRNQSGVLDYGFAIDGNNAYPGGVAAANIGVGTGATKLDTRNNPTI